MPDYARFCASLGLRFLAIQDGDASKRDAQAGVEAVRTAVGETDLGVLFEFPENIETSLSAARKDVQTIDQAMRRVARTTPRPEEIANLDQELSNLVNGTGIGD